MQINRLLEIVYVLFEKENVTARELAEYFEVSQRTIYRDIEALSAAGIPVYTNKGKGGGIRLMEQYVIKKSMLTEVDQLEIISSLQGMRALHVSETEPLLKKLAVLFQKEDQTWIDVDFSNWSSSVDEKKKFVQLKQAILTKRCIRFYYYGANATRTERVIEPLQLKFKGQAWYVHGFCRKRQDFRIFRLSRMDQLCLLNECFQMRIAEEKEGQIDKIHIPPAERVTLTLKISSSMAFRVYDEFNQEEIVKNEDESFLVTKEFPEEAWLYGYILSFGEYVEVVQPMRIRKKIYEKLQKSLKNYF